MIPNFTRLLTFISFFLLLILLSSSTSYAQKNTTYQDSLFFDGGLSDIWGYAADGREYALIGKQQGFAVVDVTDPTLVELLYEVPGTQSTWRDIKTWGNYAYMVDDQAGEGMLIVDLSQAPDAFNHTWWYGWPNCNGNHRSHNIFIDEKGFAYLTGTSCAGGIEYGMLILDLNQNPLDPPVVGIYEHDEDVVGFSNYVHDAFVRGDTAWLAQINDGLLVVADVSDKANIQVLGSAPTSSNFTHNLWLSDDGKHLYTTDEVSNGYIDSYNVEDLSDIKRLDIIQSSPGENVIPHNTFFIDDYLVTSYYTDGVTIHDVSNPSNMIQVGNYDTSPNYSGDGYDGCWGVYPYLPSGNIIAADIQDGLYVIKPEYVRASQLEVSVVDQDGNPVSGASVEIESLSILTSTNLTGVATTGSCEEGTYTVSINGGAQLIPNVEMISGELTSISVEVQTSDFTINVKDWEGTPIEGAGTILTNGGLTYSRQSDEAGQVVINNVVEGSYEVYVGAWGYETLVIDAFEANAANNDTEYLLTPGYQDDFVMDFGWETSGDAEDGDWERTEPTGTLFFDGETQVAPELDVDSDLGDQCFVTGDGTTSFSANDVDDGAVILTSPLIDLTGYEDPYLNYYYWFTDFTFSNQGAIELGNDSLTISLVTDEETIVVDFITADSLGMMEWIANSHRLKDFIDTAVPFRVQYRAADDEQDGHLVEAAIDAFSIVDSAAALVEFSSVVNDENGNGLLSELVLTSGGTEIQTSTNVFGGVSFTDLEPGVYTLTAGSWGYITQTFENIVVNEDGIETYFVLEEGYVDNFSVNLGWEINGEDVSGSSAVWELGQPEGTDFNGSFFNPYADVQEDKGNQCYTTGLTKGEGDANSNDVDGGPLSLTSPSFDLSDFEEAWISFHYWFANGGGTTPIDDALTVSLSNGVETVEVASIDGNSPAAWTKELIRVPDFLDQTGEMNLIFTVTDQGEDHITEAAIDYFTVVDSVTVQPGIQSLNLLDAQVAPNPVEATTIVTLNDFDNNQSHQLYLTDLQGRIVLEQKITQAQTPIFLKDLSSGLYLLSIKRGGELVYVEKLLKE